jgi:hypothetical protein
MRRRWHVKIEGEEFTVEVSNPDLSGNAPYINPS